MPVDPQNTEAGLELSPTLDYEAEYDEPAALPVVPPGSPARRSRTVDIWRTAFTTGAITLEFEVRLKNRDQPTDTMLAGRLLGLPEPRQWTREALRLPDA